MKNHPLSLEHETFHNETPQTLISLAAKHGFQGVCLRVIPSRKDNFPIVGDTPMRREVKQMCNDTGVSIKAGETAYVGPRFDAQSQREMLETCFYLGIPHLSIIGIDTDMSRLGDNVAAYGAVAAEYGVRPYIEATVLSSIKNSAHALEIIRNSGATNIGIGLDAMHLTRADKTAASIAEIDPSMICYMQICDGLAGLPENKWFDEAWGERLVPGEGEFTIAEFVDALPDGITIGIEAPNRVFNESGASVDGRVRHLAYATRTLLGDRLLPPSAGRSA